MSATVLPRPRVPSMVFQLMRFGLVGATNTALTLATYAALVSAAVSEQHLPRIAGELAVLPPLTLLTFVLCRGWVFAAGVPA
jgi:putative flippase GtrA